MSTVHHAESEVAAANFPRIRMFTAEPCAAVSARRTVGGEWVECTPETADSFSAVGYFFARELHQRLGAVPVGILNASWGGTLIEAWTSLDALGHCEDVNAILQRQTALEADLPRLQAAAVARTLEWEAEALPADPGNTGEAKGWAEPDFDDGDWPPMRVPGSWQSRGLHHNGVVWFRRTIDIPQGWSGRDLILTLGAIDDFDTTYFDGHRVGSHPKGTPEAYRVRRRYVLPSRWTQAGRAVIAVRVFDHFGEGGFMGPASEMQLAPADGNDEPMRLAGAWKYQVEHAIDLVPASVFQTYPQLDVPLPQHRLAALYNGMIAPLVGYGMRGAIWYQGESNVGQYRAYRQRMITMIRDWRSRWGLGQFAFLFVQLPNYRGGLEWPYLREAQAQALSEPNTAMAVTLDVGDADDIHPRNKQPVGYRLALHALALCHGHPRRAALGPALCRIDIDGDRARVHFDNADGLATDAGDPVLGFELAGSDGIYRRADAAIDGHSVLVRSPDVPAPVDVRYAWSDAPSVNLRNAAGLPAQPFRTDGR